MADSGAAAVERRQIRRSFTIWGVVSLVFVVLLLPVFPLEMRESVSALGLLLGGLTGTVAGSIRAYHSHGAARRPWALLAAASVVAIVGNVWVAITGADPVTSPSFVSNLTISVALVLSTFGLLAFPTAPELQDSVKLGVLAGSAASTFVGAALLLAANPRTPNRVRPQFA